MKPLNLDSLKEKQAELRKVQDGFEERFRGFLTRETKGLEGTVSDHESRTERIEGGWFWWIAHHV